MDDMSDQAGALLTAIDAVVEQLLDNAGVAGPPVDALQLAQDLGLALAVDHRQAGRARYATLHWGRGRRAPSILLRPEPRLERRQWAVAHELGEHLASEVYRRAGVDVAELYVPNREQVANQFARRLLLPEQWFVPDGGDASWDLLQLKARYTTASHELIALRMLEQEQDALIVTVVDQGAIHWRRAGHGKAAPPWSAGERQCWQQVHQRGGARRLIDAGGELLIRGWAIHESGWRREILRTELADMAQGAGCWGSQ